MNWTQIWSAVATQLKDLLDNIGDATRWKMSVNGKAVGTVSSIAVNAAEMLVTSNDGQGSHTLRATPTLDHAAIDFDGTPAPDARVVFSVKSEPLAGKPVIGVFEFRPLTVGGVATEYRFDYPK
jgi:hypothetical protein